MTVREQVLLTFDPASRLMLRIWRDGAESRMVILAFAGRRISEGKPYALFREHFSHDWRFSREIRASLKYARR